MSTNWHKDFQERVAKIGASGVGANRYGQVNPLLGVVSGTNRYNLKNSAPNTVPERMWGAASAALDVISRPGYATGSFLNELIDDKEGDPLKAAWEGFTGKRKEFFQPFTTLDPHEDSDTAFDTGARFAGDFLASVVTDPLTYVPGAIILKALKGASDVTGLTKGAKAFKQFADSKPDLRIGAGNKNAQVPLNTLRQSDLQEDALRFQQNLEKPQNKWGTPTPAAPEKNPQELIDALVSEAPAIQPKVDLTDLTNPAPATSGPSELLRSILADERPKTIKSRTLDYMNDPRSRDFISSLQKDLRAVPAGPDKYGIRLGALSILRSSVADTLANVRGRYFTPDDLRSPWKEELVKVDIPTPKKPAILDEQIAKPTSTFEDVAEDFQGLTLEESARLNAVKRFYIDNPATIKAKTKGEGPKLSAMKKYKNRDIYDHGKFYYNGEEVDFGQWAKESGLLDPEGFAEFARRTDDAGRSIVKNVLVYPMNPKHPLYSKVGNTAELQRRGVAKLPVDQYADYLAKGKPVPEMADVDITKQGLPVNFNEYIASRAEKWNARQSTNIPSPTVNGKIRITFTDNADNALSLENNLDGNMIYRFDKVTDARNFIKTYLGKEGYRNADSVLESSNIAGFRVYEGDKDITSDIADLVAKSGKREVPPTKEAMAEYEKKLAAQATAKSEYEKLMKAYEEEVAAFDQQVKRIAPTTEERMAWVQAHSETIPAKELKALTKAMETGNEAAFNKVAKKLMEAEKKLDLATLDELGDAVDAGLVSKDELDKVLTELGARNLSDAKRKLASLEKAIESVKSKVNTDADLLKNMPPSIRKNALRVEKALRNAPKQFKPIPPVGVKMGDLRNMSLKRNTPERQRFMQQMYADTLSAVVEPDTYAKLTPTQISMVGDHVIAMAAREFESPVHWKFTTKGGAKAATPRPYDGGKRRWLQEYNDRPQYTFWKELLADVNGQAKIKLAAGELKPGFAFNKFKRDTALPVLLATEDVLRAYGMQPSLWPGGQGIALSWGDVITSMGDAAQINYVFNMNKQITQDQLFRIAERALEHVDTIDDPASLEGFRGFVREVLGEGDDLAKEARYSNSAKTGAQFAMRNTRKKATEAALQKYGVKSFAELPDGIQKQILNKGGAIYEKEMKAAIDAVANPSFVRSIAEKVARNSAQAEIQFGEYVGKFSNELIERFLADVSKITTPDEVFALVDNARKGVRGFMRKNSDIVPPPSSIQAINEAVTGSTLNFGTEFAQKNAQAYTKAGTIPAKFDVSYSAMRATDDWVSKNILGDPATRQMVEMLDLSDGIEMGLMSNIIFQTFPHLQTAGLRNLHLNAQNFGRLLSEQFSRRLSRFERTYGKAEAKVIFEDIRKGAATKSPAHVEMANIIAQIFDIAQSGYGPLQRHGLDPRHINANLKHFGIHDNFQLKGKTTAEAFGSWMYWPEVDEPLDLFSKYHAAIQKTLMEKQFGATVSYKFGSRTMRKTADGKNYVRVTASKGGSRMAHLIDTRLYYPPDVAEAFRFMDKTLDELAKPRSTNAFWKIFDTLTHKLKSGLTIYRPGHHMRNMFGDVWLTAMDGIYDPRHYTTAWDIMRSRTRFYSDDIRDMMRRAGELDFDGSKGIATHVSINGKKVPLSHDTVYRLMYRNGGLPGYATIEDLTVGSTFGQAENVAGKISLAQPAGGRVHDAAVRVSEYRDHYVRIAHFLGLLKRASIKGKKLPGESEEAFVARMLDDFTQSAASRIRKYHPDGSDLTQFERDVAKRGVLFYSWIRKTIPNIVQMYFIQPGRFLMFPKAMYSLAEANGIDLNGFTDPFPTDQLFPAWMGATQGPIAGDVNEGYIGMKMGIPQMDIMDQYFTSPGETLQTVFSSLHPAGRIPAELFFGETSQGVPIKDTGKYLLGQIPYGNLVNTTAGGFSRLAGGEGNPIGGVTPADANYNPGGFRDPTFLAWLNTLSGMGFQDMSKPSYIKSGEFDVKYGRITQ